MPSIERASLQEYLTRVLKGSGGEDVLYQHVGRIQEGLDEEGCTTQVENLLLEMIIGPWARYRLEVERSGGALDVSDEQAVNWTEGGSTVLYSLLESDGVSTATKTRILAEARADSRLQPRWATGTEWTPGMDAIHILVRNNQLGFTSQEVQDATFTLLHGKRYQAHSLVLDALAQEEDFDWPDYARVEVLLFSLRGTEYLAEVKKTVDIETWNGLVSSWTGTVQDLVTACMLVHR